MHDHSSNPGKNLFLAIVATLGSWAASACADEPVQPVKPDEPIKATLPAKLEPGTPEVAKPEVAKSATVEPVTGAL